MYIQNYEDLDGECKDLAEHCGMVAEAIIGGKETEYVPPYIAQHLRSKLMELSQKTGLVVELNDVRGEVWINIRERKPISKEAIRELFVEEQPNWKEKVRAIAKEYHEMGNQSMTDRIKSQWKWKW